MKHILSIQSHVVSGYVGNRSAVFPLQRLGCEVSFINTVQFSNHTGHGSWTGDIFPASHIQDVIDGLWKNYTLDHLDAVLSGYQGKPELGRVIIDTVKAIKQKTPRVIYCCDPVIGDIGRGVYVLPETAEFIKQYAIDVADILTPNQFELGYLTNMTINTLDDIRNACQQLHQRGPKIIVVTSVTAIDKSDDDQIGMLVSNGQEIWLTHSPYFQFTKAPSGSGDATAAIFLAKYLETNNMVSALEHTTAAMHAIFAKTHAMESYELRIISAQDEIVCPSKTFSAEKIFSS
jgi:pyridoxine kinase